jgi:hypothetical protein
MLAGVEEVDDLNRAREVLIGQVPDPFGAITDHDFLAGVAPAPFPGFHIQTIAELFGGFDGGHIGGGAGIASRVPLLIQASLGEDTAQLDLARARWLTGAFARAALGLALADGNSSAIHQDVQNGNLRSDPKRQLQLDRTVDFLLIALRNVGSDSLGRALHGLGRDSNACQKLQFLPALIEGGLLPDQGLHSADPGREFGVDNVQFRVGRKLSLMAVGAKVVGARQRGHNRFGALFLVACLVAARTGNRALRFRWRGEMQELGQGGRAGLPCGGSETAPRGCSLLRAGLPLGPLAPFFFLRRQGVFHRSSPANLLVHLQQVVTEALEAMKGFHFRLGLAQVGR